MYFFFQHGSFKLLNLKNFSCCIATCLFNKKYDANLNVVLLQFKMLLSFVCISRISVGVVLA